jgi:hypothetical protein
MSVLASAAAIAALGLSFVAPTASTGSFFDPTQIAIGTTTHQQLGHQVRVENVRGLPGGLTLDSTGLLSGMPDPRSGDYRVTVDLIDGPARGERSFTLAIRGEQRDVVTRTYEVPASAGFVNVYTGFHVCPSTHPWTINEDKSGREKLTARGVTTNTIGDGIEVWVNAAWDQGDRASGMSPGFMRNWAWWGSPEVHFVLHCTNDLNRARMR